MFDENRDSKGEIALANILVVETSADPQVCDYSLTYYSDLYIHITLTD